MQYGLSAKPLRRTASLVNSCFLISDLSTFFFLGKKSVVDSAWGFLRDDSQKWVTRLSGKMCVINNSIINTGHDIHAVVV